MAGAGVESALLQSVIVGFALAAIGAFAWLLTPATSADVIGDQSNEKQPAGSAQDTSKDPFIRTGEGKDPGDPFPVYWDGVWHLYTMSADATRVLHFTSTDLVARTGSHPQTEASLPKVNCKFSRLRCHAERRDQSVVTLFADHDHAAVAEQGRHVVLVP